jgi:hypothetical protein
MKFHEAYLGVYPTTDPRDSEYDPILVKAYHNLSYMNLSPHRFICSTCGNNDWGISYPLTMEFKCRACLLNEEINRLHSIPEEERVYRVWKLKRARKDHELKAKIVAKPIAKVSMDDLDSVGEFEKFIRAEYEQALRELEAKNYPFKLDGSNRQF